MKYYKISSLDAVKLLNDRYHLNIDFSNPLTSVDYSEIEEKRELKETIKFYKNSVLNSLCFCIRTYHKWQREYAPITSDEEPSQQFIYALSNIDRTEYLYNVLNELPEDKVIEYYNKNNEEVKKYVKQCRRTIHT